MTKPNDSKLPRKHERQIASSQFQQALDHLDGLTAIEAHEKKSNSQNPAHLSRVDWEEVGEDLSKMIELGEDF